MSTFSKIRVGKKGASAGVPKLIAEITFDPSIVPVDTGFTLPVGAVILGATAVGSATGGSTPTMDIGLLGNLDGIVAEGDADAGTAVTGVGTAILAAPLTANTAVWAGKGASAATGGTAIVYIEYYIKDALLGVNQ